MIKMVTWIGRDDVTYQVVDTDNYPDQLLWQEKVKLKSRGRNAPGGVMCSRMAREQEKIAFKYAKEKRAQIEKVLPPAKTVNEEVVPEDVCPFCHATSDQCQCDPTDIMGLTDGDIPGDRG